MPRTTVSVELDDSAERVWERVADPARLPRWWPAVDRVDRPDQGTYTRWMISSRGRAVEMIFELDALEPGRLVRWRQQLEGTPFRRSVRSSREAIEVRGDRAGSVVTLTIDRRLRGSARLGAPFIRRGQRRELDAAATALARMIDGS